MLKVSKALRVLGTGRGIYGLCVKLGFSAHISRVITKLLRSTFSLFKIIKRRSMGRVFLRANMPGLQVDKHARCGTFHVFELPFGQMVLERAREIWSDRQTKTHAEGGADGKYYRSDLLDKDDLIRYPEFLLFATSKELVSSVTDYLGTFPVLGGVRLWYTKANDSTQSAQQYHIDQEDFHQLKIFVNINEVSRENGPLTIIKAQASRRIFKEVQDPFHRVTDDDIFTRCNSDDVVELVGPAGSGGYADTSSCFHMGSRTRSGGRLLLMISYYAFPVIRETSDTIFSQSTIPWAILPEYSATLLSDQ